MLRLDRKTLIILSVIASIIIIAIIVIVIRNKNKNSSGGIPDTGNSNPIKTAIGKVVSSVYKTNSFPLAEYMKGDNVGILQRELNRRGATLTVDGNFGPDTLSALQKYENMSNVTEDKLNAMVAENINGLSGTPINSISSLPNASTTDGSLSYAKLLFNNLVNETDITGRNSDTENGLYNTLANMSDSDFTNVYNQYKNTYGRDLATDINNATFSLFTSVDSSIVTKASKLNLASVTNLYY